MKPVIHSQKHYVQASLFTASGGAAAHTVVVDAVALGDVTTPNEVIEGATVKAVFVEMWLKSGEVSELCTANWILYKCPAGVGAVTFTQMQTLSDYPNKKNILVSGQGLVNNEGANAIAIIRG